jgi:hypothetical protein
MIEQKTVRALSAVDAVSMALAIEPERPLAVDLFCGLGGWTDGLLAEGWRCRGYDIEAHEYDGERYPAELVLKSVLDLHGAELADVDLIVASPPCQEFSYMAMPWTRAKQIARALRGEDVFPEPYKGSRTIADLTALFDACFRIQREANEVRAARGQPPIPMVVENVRGAEPWVGRAMWNFGSYYLWGDVPALMPGALRSAVKHPGMDWNGHPAGSKPVKPDFKAVAFNDVRHDLSHRDDEARKNPGFRFDGSGRSFQSESVARHVEGVKVPAEAGRRTDKGKGARFTSRDCGVEAAEGRKGAGAGAEWFDQNLCQLSSKSSARKAASARIAKIPSPLSRWIARCYFPDQYRSAKSV